MSLALRAAMTPPQPAKLSNYRMKLTGRGHRFPVAEDGQTSKGGLGEPCRGRQLMRERWASHEEWAA